MVRTSQYQVLHHFSSKIHEALLRAGFQSRLIEESDLHVLLSDLPDLALGFNGCPRSKSELLCDYLKIPYLSLLVDPPYRFFYLVKSPYTIIGCDDRYGCTFLQSLDFNRTIFAPHAVERELLFAEEKGDPIFDVAMLATFIDHEQRRKEWKSKFPAAICKVMDDAIDLTFSDPTLSFIAAFDQAIVEDQKKHPLVPFEGVNLTTVLEELEIYIKGRDRVELIKSVPDCTIHLFGNALDNLDWKKFLGKSHPNINVHGSVSFKQAIEIMKKTKVLLNPSLKNKNGAHERIFTGLASGAAVVTNESLYLRETFDNNQGLIFYPPSRLENVNEQVLLYLSNEKERRRQVEEGQRIVLNHHTWDQRVADIAAQIPPFLKLISEK